MKPLTYLKIDLKAIRHNIREVRRLAKRNKFELPTRPAHAKKTIQPNHILAVIKADAYGHGMEKVARVLEKEGIEFFGVSDVVEGIQLRAAKIKKPILLFESTLPECVNDIVKHNLMPSVCTLELAKKLNDRAKRARKIVDVHIKVDTGMGRLGVWHEGAFRFIGQISRLKNLRIMGIFTHFPAADTDKTFTRHQIHELYNLVTSLDKTGLIIPYIHATNSMGLAGYKTHVLNVTRPGLMLYGLYPHASLARHLTLKPAMSVKSRVIFIKDIPKGQSISYGRTFFTKKKMRVATIPIGYNDGYFRQLSNKASVLINGTRCKVLGRVTMDQIIVDVTHLSRVSLGAPVVILGKQKRQEITADELAKFADTINYEIICSFGNRLPQQYIS